MTNMKKLMRQANAICKAIRKAREEIANPKAKSLWDKISQERIARREDGLSPEVRVA
jgi:hypothetical protein